MRIFCHRYQTISQLPFQETEQNSLFILYIFLILLCSYEFVYSTAVTFISVSNMFENRILFLTFCWSWLDVGMLCTLHAFLNVFSYRFIIEDEDNFFSPAERSLLVYQVLERCVFENNTDSSKNKFGVWTFNSFCFVFVFVLYIANTGEDYFMLYFNQKCFAKKNMPAFFKSIKIKGFRKKQPTRYSWWLILWILSYFYHSLYCSQTGIKKMVSSGAYDAAYPLHEVMSNH